MWKWLKKAAQKLAFWKLPPNPTQPGRAVTIGDVFTPSSPAKGAYVARPEPESDLRAALTQPGTQVVIYGESGAGKSSVATRVLRKTGRPYLTTQCTSDTDYNAVLVSGFHLLNATARTSQVATDAVTLSTEASLGGDDLGAGLTSAASWEAARERTTEPIVRAPVTAEHLAHAFGRKGCSWIIEDFHKVSDKDKESLSHALKVFSDLGATYPRTQVIVLGAAESPAAIVSGTSNIAGRLATIEVRPLTDAELGQILTHGESLLNVDFSQVRSDIIRHSVGVASITHALASYCCIVLDLDGPTSETTAITPDVLNLASLMFVRSRTPEIKTSFDKALVVKMVRRYDNHQLILRALAAMSEAGGTHAEVLAAVRRGEPDYPPGNLTLYLRELQTEARGALVRRTATGRFRFSTPMQHAYARMHFGVTEERALLEEDGTAFWGVPLATAIENGPPSPSSYDWYSLQDAYDLMFPPAERAKRHEEDVERWTKENRPNDPTN